MVAQIIAVTLFLLMFILIITDKWERHVITLGCALLTLVLVFGVGMRSMSAITETLNLGSFFTKSFWYSGGSSAETSSGINWETIVFVAGMMIMVEGMARVGFFPVALHETCQARKISGHPAVSHIYGAVFRTGDVYRQYHRHPVSCSRHN